MSDQEYLTTSQIADQLKMTKSGAIQLVDAAAKRGELVVLRPGRDRLIPRESFDAFVALRETRRNTPMTSSGGFPAGKPRK